MVAVTHPATADDLGAAAALEAYAPPGAERVYVGKRGGRPSIKQVPPAWRAVLPSFMIASFVWFPSCFPSFYAIVPFRTLLLFRAGRDR